MIYMFLVRSNEYIVWGLKEIRNTLMMVVLRMEFSGSVLSMTNWHLLDDLDHAGSSDKIGFVCGSLNFNIFPLSISERQNN